jgi:hypothetical protein
MAMAYILFRIHDHACLHRCLDYLQFHEPLVIDS